MFHKLPTPLEEPLTLCVDFASLRETSHWKEEFRAKTLRLIGIITLSTITQVAGSGL